MISVSIILAVIAIVALSLHLNRRTRGHHHRTDVAPLRPRLPRNTGRHIAHGHHETVPGLEVAA